jgi:uncharacterized protein (DUF608 family)
MSPPIDNAGNTVPAPDMPRRDFLLKSALAVGAIGMTGTVAGGVEPAGAVRPPQDGEPIRAHERAGRYSGVYAGAQLDRVAFPLGGIGAGMICVEGTGAFSHVSLRHRPDIFNEPMMFAAVCLKAKPANHARVLEGPVPSWKLFGRPETGQGSPGKSWGLPRFEQAVFENRFPLGIIRLRDSELPLDVEITAWSPFEPGDADSASLPVAGLEYRFTNRDQAGHEGVFSFHCRNFMASQPAAAGAPGSEAAVGADAILAAPGGFVLHQDPAPGRPWEAGDLCVRTDDPATRVNHAWFRGGWYDALTMTWKDIQAGACRERPPVKEGPPAPGASLFVPFALGPGESRRVVVQLSWYVGESGIRFGEAVDAKAKNENYTGRPGYQAWYTGRFKDVREVSDYWHDRYPALLEASRRFSTCLQATTLPGEVLEAVATNLSILKSPTVLRQADGRLWGWEGCKDGQGCCYGSCTHVWNYAQAIPHLFPSLERTLRETEFQVSQDDRGHQAFRTPLPVRQPVHEFHSAADGQLGGIMKVYRDWRISGDLDWVRKLWPSVRRGMDYCMATWDPRGRGLVEEPHHNTYDIEFWGPDSMCTSFYLGALKAAISLGRALGEDVTAYEEVLAKGKAAVERDLYNGEYFFQRIEWENLQAGNPTQVKSFAGQYSPEAVELLKREGPKYQYGTGCLSDGVLGEWLAWACGVEPILDPAKVRSHLEAVHRHNLKKDLFRHANPQRPSYACGHEGGLLLCTWPRGGQPSLPFIYSNEVWTGIEYQAAAHMMSAGLVEEGLEVVRTCMDRYDGRVRNPFNQYECGHWYARSMSSYALLQGLTGIRYDAVDRVLHIAPKIRGDFKAFFAAAGGYGLAGVENGRPFCRVVHGAMPAPDIRYTPA